MHLKVLNADGTWRYVFNLRGIDRFDAFDVTVDDDPRVHGDILCIDDRLDGAPTKYRAGRVQCLLEQPINGCDELSVCWNTQAYLVNDQGDTFEALRLY